MMKKALLFALSLLLVLPCSAQTIRTNYRAGGITHISTEYEDIQFDAIPAQVRVELAGFADGSTLYLLYINLVEKTSSVVPKGVKMAATLTGGKLVRMEQIGEDSATKRRLKRPIWRRWCAASRAWTSSQAGTRTTTYRPALPRISWETSSSATARPSVTPLPRL